MNSVMETRSLRRPAAGADEAGRTPVDEIFFVCSGRG
jgi:hypothetical protein